MRTFFQPEPSESIAESGLEGVILDGARRCLLRLGSKMTVGDVAKAAGVSRGSVYKYFVNRDQLREAVNELCFDLFTGDMDLVMAQRGTFAEQAAAAAVEIRRWNQASDEVRQGGLVSSEELAQVLTRGSRSILAKEMNVVRGYLEAARDRGEVRHDLDLDRASEWVVRVLHSFSTNPALTFDEDDFDEVEAFVEEFVVRGLG